MSRKSDSYRSPSLPSRPRLAAALPALLAVILAAGCAPRPAGGPGEQGTGKAEEAGAERVEVTDGIGRRVLLPRRPRRIVSLAPNVTETLFMLGAGDRLIGVTTLCAWPEAARALPKIGDLLNPNYEVILAARPDLVIGSTAGNDRGAGMKLTGLGLPVYVVSPRSAEEIFRSVEEIGRITDRAAEGRLLAARMRARLDAVRRRIEGLPPGRAFFITWFDPPLAPGRNTFENAVLALAGVVSISAATPQSYPRYSLEPVLASAPDAILTIEHEGDPLPRFDRTPGWKELRAVREGRVYFLSEYLQHPSPLFVDGVEDLARQLYPERFP